MARFLCYNQTEWTSALRLHIMKMTFKEMTVIRKFLRDEDGQDIIEWGLLVTFLGIMIIAGISLTGITPVVSGWYTTVTDVFN